MTIGLGNVEFVVTLTSGFHWSVGKKPNWVQEGIGRVELEKVSLDHYLEELFYKEE